MLKLKELSDLYSAANREQNPEVKAHQLEIIAHITEQAGRITQLEKQLERLKEQHQVDLRSIMAAYEQDDGFAAWETAERILKADKAKAGKE